MLKFRQIVILSIVLFIFLSVLGFLNFLTRLGLSLGERIGFFDRLIAWLIIIFTFPIRNIANLFSENNDLWLRHTWGALVILGSSIIWAVFILIIKSKSQKKDIL